MESRRAQKIAWIVDICWSKTRLDGVEASFRCGRRCERRGEDSKKVLDDASEAGNRGPKKDQEVRVATGDQLVHTGVGGSRPCRRSVRGLALFMRSDRVCDPC